MQPIVRYRTQVDSDVDYDAERFHKEIMIYLADPDGWSRLYRFVYTPKGPAKVIRLSSPHTLKVEGCRNDSLSCATLNGSEIWLNADRWMNGAPPSRLSLDDYRQYLVSHEMGHSLGYQHVKCPGYGPAPIMLQQTLGIGACTPNTKITLLDLQSKN